ncbi:altronate hydrolase [Escherichia coli]|nr:altronate hydrolase [Escherichia coli]
MQYIKIHALDNVAVALADLAEGTEVSVDNQTVTLRQDVARGHKFALTDIAKGANVIKYGLPIGYALADIAAGVHVHAHNTRTNLSDLDQYRYQPDFQDLPAQAADREVQIYRRANGDVGVRNELWILPTVGCVNGHRAANPEPFPERDQQRRRYRRRVPLQPHLRLLTTGRRSHQHPHHAAKHGAPPERGRSAGDWSGL